MTPDLIAVGATAAAISLIEKLPALAGIWAKNQADKRARNVDKALIAARDGAE